MALHRFASERGWLREARDALERARERLPDGPEVLVASLEEAQRGGDVEEIRRLTGELASQDALDDSFATLLAHEGRYEEAEAIWREIIDLVPASLDPLLALATARREAGDYQGAASLLEEAVSRFPTESGLLLRHAFLLELLGRSAEAEERYRQALRHDPARLEVLRHLRRRSGFDPDFGYRVDVAQVMAEAPEPEEGTNSGLLLDQSITWVDRTGGAVERYHALIQVYTRAGVEQNSQPQVPPGSRYLTLRVIKPDGTTYEPDPREGGEVTLPNLEPGDFYEYRYERYQPPSAQVPGAYDNDVLFVFQGGQRPYVLSQYVLVHDATLEVRADGRFEGLETEDRREGDLRIRSWTARDMPSLRLEPGIPNVFDMSPHVRLTYRIDWSDVATYLRDGWTPLLRPTPELREAARQLALTAEGTLGLARAVHDHVTESVRPAGPSIDFSTPASVSYSSGRGNRVLVAKALFELLGVESELVVARPVPEKGVFLDSPNPNQFSYPLLRVREGETEAYLDLVDSDHPFDRIPFFLRGSDALVVPATAGEEPRIEILPETSGEPPRFGLEADLRLAEDGTVSGRALQSFRDVAADQLRQNLRTVPESQRRQVYARVADLLFPGAIVSRASARGLEEVSGSVVLDLEWEGGSFGGGDGSLLRVPTVIRPLALRRSWASLESRRFPLLVDDPESLEETYRIEPPAGYRLERIPETVEVDGEFGHYRIEVTVEEGLVTVRRTVELPYQRIEPEDYPRFVAFAGTIDRAEQRLLEFLR
jgi:tetratricopeptide (TPR) repeat protein